MLRFGVVRPVISSSVMSTLIIPVMVTRSEKYRKTLFKRKHRKEAKGCYVEEHHATARKFPSRNPAISRRVQVSSFSVSRRIASTQSN